MDIAASLENSPPVIRRQDYRPPDWLVPTVALSFALGIDETAVTAALDVTKNPAGSGDAAIRLKGDGISARAVSVDGLAHDDWRMDGHDLLIDLPGDAHAITIETAINPAALILSAAAKNSS